jgi:RNA polymerase sigma-70 factor (ECF subfamily)
MIHGARAKVARDDPALLDALRHGDEAAFEELIGRYHQALTRSAMLYVGDPAIAQEVAQETWVALLNGLTRFEGRSSLKTWLFTVVANRARSRAQRERRCIPFSEMASSELATDEPAVEPQRFATEPGRLDGHWNSLPRDWQDTPESSLLSDETQAVLRAAIETLPATQRAVVTLRDVEGLTAGEVCNLLDLSETNQRVLLHRGRSKIRRALERYLDRGAPR